MPARNSLRRETPNVTRMRAVSCDRVVVVRQYEPPLKSPTHFLH